MDKLKLLSNNTLKIIACIAMLLDHAAVLIFTASRYPNLYPILRSIGRIAFPIFAFMLAEGCFYTKNKTRHFLVFATFSIIIQLIYMAFDGWKFDASIMTVFLISIILIRYYDYAEKMFFSEKKWLGIILFICLLMLVVGLFFLDNTKPEWFRNNYGYYGMIAPFILYVVKKRIGMKYVSIAVLAVLIVVRNIIWPTLYCNYALISLVFLILYNEKPVLSISRTLLFSFF